MSKILLFLLLLTGFSGFAQTKTVVVAQDGSGNFRTVQAALDAVPLNNKTPIIIFIRKGIYKEKLNLAKKQNFVKLMGEDLNTTILTFDDYNGRTPANGEPLGTSEASTFRAFGNDFSAENITFENTAGTVGQGPAMWVYGDRAKFVNCRFLGFRDTLYVYGYGSRQYYKNCYIEGTTDYILGSATAYFEECTLFCKTGGTVIIAASTPDSIRYGIVLQRCKIGGEAPPDSYFLARPWKPFGKTVLLNCELSNIIKPKGWDHWGKESNKQDAFFAEYKSTGDGAAPKARILWSRQLTPQQAAFYTREAVLGNWNPLAGE
ncbi:pectinesterase family protein [Hymenobacter sp. 5317J-9]|uniref:pectinesterase family protein n=1 Tax=Hymenobacter sp. 5317J-9 TaxID=2932250 RepID=UPI001FD68192|nr:pectinesterase family protein [Hymenobacter sp. 5317J-9]UOQ97545.1 pectinesterase family protein [Hymenobacter sp. 5317J-9]